MKTIGLALILAFGLTLSACGQEWWKDSADYSLKPNQQEVTDFIWSYYKMTDRDMPIIGWIDYTDCKWEGFPGFWDGEMCVDGDTMASVKTVLLMSSQWDVAPHLSAIEHELCHMRSWIVTGDADADHKGPCFVPGGYVDQVTALMIAKGY